MAAGGLSVRRQKAGKTAASNDDRTDTDTDTHAEVGEMVPRFVRAPASVDPKNLTFHDGIIMPWNVR